MEVRGSIASYWPGGQGGLTGTASQAIRYRSRQLAFALERFVLSDRQWYDYRVSVNQFGVEAAADPLQLRRVDPNEIRKSTAFHPHFCWRKIGAVKAGNWDVDQFDLLDKPYFREIYDALQDRYVEEMPWEEISLVQDVLDGKRHWHHHIGDEVWEWCEHLDQLYENMRSEGYLSQRDVLDMTFQEACQSDSVSILEWIDDIAVDIGRNGRFYRHEGKHRIWMAQILNIERIPVCVIVRHAKWQDLRDEIASANHMDELNRRARDHLDHPDMIDLRPDLSGLEEADEKVDSTVSRRDGSTPEVGQGAADTAQIIESEEATS